MFWPQTSGFVTAREVDTAHRYEPQLEFYSYDPGVPKANAQKPLGLSIPFFRSSSTAFEGEGFVHHRDPQSGRNRIHHISNGGLREFVLNKELASAKMFALARSYDYKLPRASWRIEEGSTVYGALLPDGTAEIDAVVKTPFPLNTIELQASSTDQAQVPCILEYRQDASLPLPALVSSYGAYGDSSAGRPSPRVIAILSNGIASLRALPRGGGIRGYRWAEDGKGGANKRRTVEDTQACLDLAVSKGYIKAGRVMMYGSSAGAIPAVNTALSRPHVVSAVWGLFPYMDSSGRSHNFKQDDENFGSVSDTEQAAKRMALSPYDNLLQMSTARQHYLLVCGDLDVAVLTWHCTKAHAAIRSEQPKFTSTLFVIPDTDHGIENSLLPSTLETMQVLVGSVVQTLKP
jgi:dienelactone hydrolase